MDFALNIARVIMPPNSTILPEHDYGLLKQWYQRNLVRCIKMDKTSWTWFENNIYVANRLQEKQIIKGKSLIERFLIVDSRVNPLVPGRKSLSMFTGVQPASYCTQFASVHFEGGYKNNEQPHQKLGQLNKNLIFGKCLNFS